MNNATSIRTVLFVIAVLVVLIAGQVIFAQSDGTDTDIPQWVIDRQQYETSYVYPGEQFFNTEVVARVPQWVLDRQQYETTFVYPIPTLASAQVVSTIPQWVIDRQQYETTYKYPEQQMIVPTAIVEASPGS